MEDTSVTEVWPENAKALEIFAQDLPTAWVHGMAGPTGLSREAIAVVFDFHHIKLKKRLELLRSIQVMEHEALRVMAEAREKDNRK